MYIAYLSRGQSGFGIVFEQFTSEILAFGADGGYKVPPCVFGERLWGVIVG